MQRRPGVQLGGDKLVKPNLMVKIGKLKLKNPVIAASGTFGDEYGELTDIRKLGAIVAKTITLKSRIGNPPPRLVETPSGMLNSIGLENKGVDFFIKDKLPALKKFRVPIIVSIAGDDEREFRELAKRLNRISGIGALELNLSCPNIRYGSREDLIAQDAEATRKVVESVRKATALTVIAKLSPNVTDIKKIAKAAEDGGAHSISLVNTFLGMAVDIETGKPKLGNVTGGLSGPAIKPLALRMVWDVYKTVDIPIIGIGGIMDYKAALEFILCGSSAVEVGTANFVDPKSSSDIINGIKRYLMVNNINDINKLVGRSLKL